MDGTRNDDGTLAARLTAIVESSDDAIISQDLDGTIVSWNAAAERIFGWPPDEMVGRPILPLVPEALRDEERALFERVGRGEYIAHLETVRRRRDGAEIFVDLTISPVRDAGGRIVGAASLQRDITERRHAEEMHRQAAKMEAIGRLAGGLAHDLNNQLYAVSGFAEFVARDPGVSPQSRGDLGEIQKTTAHMVSLTRQLLAFARQETFAPQVVDLNRTVTATQPMLRRLIGPAVEIEVALDAGPLWVRIDQGQLVQVLLNLVVNARDAMPKGGAVNVRTERATVDRARVRDRTGALIEPGSYASLTVEDTGEGIAPGDLARIFQPFFTTKGPGHGTGLGLATVDGIVSGSGGHTQVRSVPGRGTSIHILLPIATEPRETAPPPAAETAFPPLQARILVVDDQPSVRLVVARTLREEGFEVVEASDGKDALARLELVSGGIDLVITDLVMPRMGGGELTRELAEAYPAMPVILMSGYPRDELVPEPPGVAARPFLQKPIPPDQLLRAVRMVVERKAAKG